MLFPSIIRPSTERDMFDEFFGEFFPSTRETPFNLASPMKDMKTDVKEYADKFEVQMNVPGFSKEDLKVEFADGYLTVSAEKNSEVNETDDNGKYIRRERSYGVSTRKFYVGDGIKEDEIKAQYTKGVLQLDLPKKDVTVETTKKYIDIE